MSLLPNQSAVNRTTNFWGAGGSSVPSNLPFVVSDFNPGGNGVNTINTSILPNEVYSCFAPYITLPELPYPVIYTIYATFNLNSNGVNSGNFQISISGTTMNVSSPCNLRIRKPYFTMNLNGTCTVPANTSENISLLITNNTGEEETLNLNGSAGISIVGYPVSNQP
jgi:hypothetical protein